MARGAGEGGHQMFDSPRGARGSSCAFRAPRPGQASAGQRPPLFSGAAAFRAPRPGQASAGQRRPP
eukprot:2735119-Pyramimonas_sp.AAC.1